MKNAAKLTWGLLMLCLFLWSACQQEPTHTTFELTQTKAELDRIIENSLREGKVFDWRDQSDDMIIQAGLLTDSIFVIGYQNNLNFNAEKDMHLIDINDVSWSDVRNELYEQIVLGESSMRQEKLNIGQLLPLGESGHFPQIMVQLTNPDLIKKIRNHPMVRYVEPTGYAYSPPVIVERSDSGCDGQPNYSLNQADYTDIAPNTIQSWTFNDQSVPLAWSTTTGDQVKICIIDTGSSDNQDNLGSNFNQGFSQNRSLERYSTLYTGSWFWKKLLPPNDECGHGTSMAGVAAAPRGIDGNATGVAYNADLMTVRAVNDVIISSSNEKAGVRDALYLAGNSNVKIISMSIGTPIYSSTVADGVYYAYNHGKLIFAAAGTSLEITSWYPVIFPASMSQCIAVTGVKDQNHYQKCSTCHSGPEVVFTSVTQRSVDNDRQSVALALYSNQARYTGASSCATATTAGIAALVWSEFPNDSRSGILTKLKQASEFYGNLNGSLGYGVINANLAVGAL